MPSLKANQAWGVIAGLVIVHEFTAKDGQLLSHGIDRALEKQPVLTITAVMITALHLINVLDHPRLQRLDPYMGFGYPVLTYVKKIRL